MIHGGDLSEARARYGADAPAWLDLSTGINPHPWPVPDALWREGAERLPGAAELDALLEAARKAYRVPEGAEIVAAPGTQAIIQWLPRLAPPGKVAVVGPTYGEHAESWRAGGQEVRVVAEWREAPDAAHRVVVNPNNPDGRMLDMTSLWRGSWHCARAGGWLVIDESFADLDPGASAMEIVPEGPVVVLRSFGKFFGLAGLRLGFAVARRDIALQLRRALGPWAVSGPAVAIGTAALADADWAQTMRQRLSEEALGMSMALQDGGLAGVGGTSLYRLVRSSRAEDLHEALAAEHIWCRRFDWAPTLLRFGLPPDEKSLVRLRTVLCRVRDAVHAQGTRTAESRNEAR